MSKLRDLRKKSGLTQADLAKLIGTSSVHIGRFESGKREISKKWAEKLAPHLGVDAVELIFETPGKGQLITVIGAVQAGAWREALEWPQEDQFEVQIYDDRFDEIFGLKVIGDSMDQAYIDGTILVCRKFDEVNEFPPIGKRVIVQRRNENGLIEATVKELELIDGKPFLSPKSSNPVYLAIEFKSNGDGDDDTQIVGVVVGSYLQE